MCDWWKHFFDLLMCASLFCFVQVVQVLPNNPRTWGWFPANRLFIHAIPVWSCSLWGLQHYTPLVLSFLFFVGSRDLAPKALSHENLRNRLLGYGLFAANHTVSSLLLQDRAGIYVAASFLIPFPDRIRNFHYFIYPPWRIVQHS